MTVRFLNNLVRAGVFAKRTQFFRDAARVFRNGGMLSTALANLRRGGSRALPVGKSGRFAIFETGSNLLDAAG